MKLREFLYNYTKVGDFIIFREGGWRIGCTVIDHEDLFMQSLNPVMLDKYVQDIELPTDPYVGTRSIVAVDLCMDKNLCQNLDWYMSYRHFKEQ